MKIAYICTEKLPSPAVKGGAIQVLIDGVAPIISKKHNLTIISVTDQRLPNYEVVENIEFIRLASLNYEHCVSEILSQKTYDLIQVFNRPQHIPLYKRNAPKSYFILSLHNDLFSSEKISKKLGQKVINLVDKIITISGYIYKTLVERFPQAQNKTSVVYSGIDLTKYPLRKSPEANLIREIYRKKYNIQDQKVIIFVGRLSKNKGPDLLIKAMRNVLIHHKNSVLIICGGKWYSDDGVNDYVRYLHYLSKPFKRNIIFTKYIPHDQIRNIYLLGDIFVCSSQWQEPLARVHYEAMAASLPIITTNRGGNTEVIHHMENGIVIEKYDRPQAFAEKINFLLTNTDVAKEMGERGRHLVEKNFQFRHVAKKLLEIYNENLLNKKGLPRLGK